MSGASRPDGLPDLPKTIDNVSCRLGDDIACFLTPDARASIASTGFSLAAFEHLADELEQVKSVRFVFTAPAFVPEDAVKEPIRKERREFFIPGMGEASVLGTEYEIRLRNRLMQKAVAKRCGDWIRKDNVTFMSVAEYGQLQDMFIVESASGNVVYLPFNGFTADTLGYERGQHSSAISTRVGGVHADPFLARFSEIWTRGGLRDVTAQLADHVSTVYRDNEPELVYFLVLKHLFEEALRDFDEDSMPNAAVGYENSAVWKKLFDFQRDAAIAIINKLEKYNGCILADAVGLGKTFTALALNPSFVPSTPDQKRLLREARAYLSALSARTRTLLEIAIRIAQAQAPCLLRGFEYLAPASMTALAADLSLSASTISRAIDGKAAILPSGQVIELRAFFSPPVSPGSPVSTRALRLLVRRIVQEESPTAPLSDAAIADRLAHLPRPVRVHRRTVAKIRAALHIPPAPSPPHPGRCGFRARPIPDLSRPQDSPQIRLSTRHCVRTFVLLQPPHASHPPHRWSPARAEEASNSSHTETTQSNKTRNSLPVFCMTVVAPES